MREFAVNAVLLLSTNLLVKSFYLFGIDRTVQNTLAEGEYGLYFALFNFTFLFQIINDFGIQVYNSRNLARHRQLLSKYFPNLLLLKCLLGLVYLVLLPVAGLLSGYERDVFLLLMAIGFNQWLLSLLLYLRSNLTGLGLYRVDSLASVLDRVLLILICGTLLWLPPLSGKFQLSWFVLAHTAAYGLSIFLLLALLRPRLGKLSWRWRPAFLLSLLRSSLPYALAVFLMTAYSRLDAVMIERMLPNGASEADVYAAAYRLLDACNIAGYLLAGLLLPMFARLLQHRESPAPLVRLALQSLWAGAISLAAGAWYFRTPIMTSLYTRGDAYAGDVMGWLLVTFVAMSGIYVYSTLLTAHGDLRRMNHIFVAGLVINVVLNLLLIPSRGAWGAAVATCFTQFFVLAAQIVLAIRYLRLPVGWALPMRLLLFTGLAVLNAWWWQGWGWGWPWPVKFAAGICSSLVLAFLVRLIDWRAWMNWLRPA